MITGSTFSVSYFRPVENSIIELERALKDNLRNQSGKPKLNIKLTIFQVVTLNKTAYIASKVLHPLHI